MGFYTEDIYTHSVISSSLMAIFLENMPVFLIMVSRICSSGALLEYIKANIHVFNKG